MSDWRKMQAGIELDQAIAERLGYTNLVQSGLSKLLWGTRQATDEDHIYHIDDNGTVDDPIPQYSTSTDAALSLPLDDLLFFDLHGQLKPDSGMLDEAGTWNCWVDHRFDDYAHDRYVGRADTPALAVCRAWLAWKERSDR